MVRGFHFVLARPLNSDLIEQIFGAIRVMMGGDFQSHAVAVTQAVEKILRSGFAYCCVNFNVLLTKEKEQDYLLIKHEGTSKKKANLK